MNRKNFLKTISGGTLALTLAPNLVFAESSRILNPNSEYKLTILHTNDQHSRIEPLTLRMVEMPIKVALQEELRLFSRLEIRKKMFFC
jgi:5'-nucleotidase